MKLRKACASDMPTIYNIALKYDLESDDMKADEFLVAEENNNIIGIGRLKIHPDAIELGTIGVVEEYRNKGIATKIINALLKKTNSDVYLTTLIPEFFEQFGFRKLGASPPDAMIRTKEWCEGCKKQGCILMVKILNSKL